MVIVPERFIRDIKQIIEWHLDAYIPDKMSDIRLKRILENFYQKHVDGVIRLEENELYCLYECISDATNYSIECGVEEYVVWEIYDWIKPIYDKA